MLGFRYSPVLFTAVIFIVPLFGQPGGTPQQDPPRFKVQSSNVVVDVIVADRKGNVVKGLTAGDFRVFESGVPQKIISFESPFVVAPAAGLSSSENAPSAYAQPPDKPSSANLRLITIVLDVSGMKGASLQTSIEAASRFVDNAAGEQDYIAVYSVGYEVRLIVPFSRDKRKIKEGLLSLSRATQGIHTARGRAATTASMDNIDSDVQTLNKAGDPASLALAGQFEQLRLMMQTEMGFQNDMQTRVLFRALRSIAQASGSLPGRKNVVLFSEGLPASTETDAGVAAVIDAANRANVAFYVVDPSGLGGEGDVLGSFDASAVSGGRRASQVARDNANAARRPSTPAHQAGDVVGGDTKFDVARQRSNADGGRDGLRNVADQTGGLLIKNQNELKYSFERIDRDLREHYTLTYQSQDSNNDGSFRKINVEVAGAGHSLRYRKGYYAIPAGEEVKVTPVAAQLLSAAASGSLRSTVKTKLNAAMLFGSSTELSVPVSIWLPGDLSWVSRSDQGFASTINLVITARDSRGKLLDVFQKFVDARWSPEEWKGIEKKGVQIISSLTIPQLESVELEAVLQFSNGGASMGKTKLTMPGEESGAHLTTLFLTPRVEVAPEARQGEPRALHVSSYQLLFPVRQEFAQADKLTLYFGIDNVSIDASSGRPRINLALALRSGDHVVRQLPADALFPWPQSPSRIFYLNQFDLTGLAPGAYTLEATLKDLARKTISVHTASFSIQ